MFGWKIAKGTSRNALLTKNYAIKFPVLYSWEFFLRGLVDNMTELKWAEFSQAHTNTAHLCPTLRGNRFGFCNVMQRAVAVTDIDLFWDDFKLIVAEITLSEVVAVPFIESDAKPDNFGYLNGVLVKIDYAT